MWLQWVLMPCARIKVCAHLVCLLHPNYGTAANPQESELISVSQILPRERERGRSVLTKHLGTSKAWKSCAIAPQEPPHDKSMHKSLQGANTGGSCTRLLQQLELECPSPPAQTPWHPSPVSVPQPWGWFNSWHVGCSVHIPFGNPLSVFWVTPRSTHTLTFSFREEWSFTHTMNIASEGCYKAPLLTPRPTLWQYGACLGLAYSSPWIISLQSQCIKVLSLPHKELWGLINWHREVLCVIAKYCNVEYSIQ